MRDQLIEDIDAAVDLQVRELGAFVELNPYLIGIAEKEGRPGLPREVFTADELAEVLGVVEYLYDIEAEHVIEAEHSSLDDFIELPSPTDDEISVYIDTSQDRTVRLLANQDRTRDDF